MVLGIFPTISAPKFKINYCGGVLFLLKFRSTSGSQYLSVISLTEYDIPPFYSLSSEDW